MQSPHEMRWTQPRLVAGAGIVVFALVLRLITLPHRALWLDELLSAAFATHGPFKTLLTVLRFDVHPPLYYLQLSLWGALGHSDSWLMANSIFWSVAGVALLFAVASRRYGFSVGVWAALLLAVSPAVLGYADQVRMYSFIAFLMILAWDAVEGWLQQPSLKTSAWLVLTQLLITYSHAVGLLMLSGCVVYGGVQLLMARDLRRIGHWIGLEGAVLVLSAPALLIGAVHQVPHVGVPTPMELIATWTFISTGSPRPDGPHAFFGIAVLALLGFGLAARKSRLHLACLVFTPILVIAIISYALRPVWLERVFVPMLPLLMLSLALAANLERERLAKALRLAVGCLAVAWLAFAVGDKGWRPRGDGFKPAAEALLAKAAPGQAIVMNESLVFWAMMRDLAGPDWGDPLREQFETPRWTPVIKRLPSAVRTIMTPDRQVHDVRGAQTLLLEPGQAWPDPKGDLIVVSGAMPASPPPPTTISGRVLADRQDYERVIVQRWRRLRP